MSAPFENRRVKVTGTSKPELNGQTGVARSYSASSMRYTVQLDSGACVALRPVNLQPVGAEEEDGAGAGAGAGGMPEGMPDLGQLLHMLPPWLREKLARGQVPDMTDLQRLLPPGVTVTHVGGALALFVVMVFKLGLVRAALLFGLFGFFAFFGFGAYSRAGGGINGVKAAADAVAQQVSQRVGTMSQQQLKLSPLMSMGAVGAIAVAVLYFSLVSGGYTQRSVGSAPYDSSGEAFSYSAPHSRMTLEQAYDLGYADGKDGHDSAWADHAPPRHESEDYFPAYPPPPPQAGSSGISNMFSFGKLFTVGLLAKQIYGLGSQPQGGWSHELAMANLMNQSAVQKGFLALMVLRLFGMSPI